MTTPPLPIERLLNVMKALRDPETGCPWDIKQDFSSIAPYTIEEAYEVNEAIANGARDKICDELGDLLLQVVFHAQIAAEEGSFTFDDVANSISDKMVRRHPHVFGDTEAKTVTEVRKNWEQIKAEERALESGDAVSLLDGIATTLPAMVRASKLQKRAANVGFDWPELDAVIEKLHEETDELRVQWQQDKTDKIRLKEEIGDILFVAANLARKVGVDPETALIETNRKFERRFGYIEQALALQKIPLEEAGLEKMDKLWDAAKAKERK
ncbi:MAG: nucleoside triphosphate pyrophosphohydrolase [Alphaproteobacteria bacterium]|nr:nucleoside triphosphate pyrophosphohydrolase [Alphaproteobacteria bacterium]